MGSRISMAGIALLMVMVSLQAGVSGLPQPAFTGGRAGPDIAVVPGSYGINPNPPRVQDICTVNVTVINQGDTAAGAFTVAFFMNNTGTKLNPSNTVRINSLGIGATSNVACQWNTQTTEFFAYTTGVNYTIIMLLDTLSEIAEGNEANNRFDYNQTLGPERLPDLILTSCSAVPASLIRGGTVTINATITNNGEAAGKYFKVYCFADNINQMISSVDVANLNIAEVKSVSMNWDTTDYAPGLHSVLVIVNPDFYFTKIMEPDWSNNNGTKQVTIVAPPLDLYVGSIVLTPAEPHRGDSLIINCTVKNNATSNAENISTIISIDIEELNKRTLTLAPQESVSLGAEVDTSVYGEGNHNITVSVAGIVKTKPFTLLTFRKADLVPIDVTVTPQSAKVGQVLDVSFKVHNAGDATAGAAGVSLLADYITAPVCATVLPAMDPDALVMVNMSWNTAGSVGGAHRLRIFLDSGYAVLEGNETNNNYVINLDLEGALDLKVENVTLRPVAPKSGEKVQFTATVKNLGSLPSNSSNVTLSIGGSPVDSKILTFVDPGLSRDASLNWQTVGLPAGTYDYSVSVVTLGNYTDANPANDAVSGTVELLPPPPSPDLKVSDVTVATSTPRTTENLTLLVKVDNIGNVDAGTSTLMIIFERGTAMLKFTDSAVQVPAITAGSSTTVNVTRGTSAFKAGTYRLIATADYSNELAELNETNNAFTMELALLEPPEKKATLAVQGVTIEGKQETGSQMTILVVVANTGAADAYNTTVKFYIDGTMVAQKSIELINKGTNRSVEFQWTALEGAHKFQVRAESAGLDTATGTETPVTIAKKPVTGGGGSMQDNTMMYIAVVVVIAAVAGGAAFAMSRRKKPPAPEPEYVKITQDKPAAPEKGALSGNGSPRTPEGPGGDAKPPADGTDPENPEASEEYRSTDWK